MEVMLIVVIQVYEYCHHETGWIENLLYTKCKYLKMNDNHFDSLGCQGQGTSDTSYLCKPCFAEQQEIRENSATNIQGKPIHQSSNNQKVSFPG